MDEPMIETRALRKEFTVEKSVFSRSGKTVAAVDGIDLSIKAGETFGLVGESGCGKSTTGRMLVRLETPTSGKILFKGQDLTAMSEKTLLPVRRNLQMIFQNPYGSLDPKMTVRQILEEPLRIHRLHARNRQKRVHDLLDSVGLSRLSVGRYPAEFSGGQRQRIAIARALALEPEFIVADEPVSALDVSIQAQMLNLLTDLQKELNLTCLFISHDLGVVHYISDRAGVMYRGRVVEIAGCRALYRHPLHPYTQMLVASVPMPDPGKKFVVREPDMPEMNEVVTDGCGYYRQCPDRKEICVRKRPELKEVAPGRQVACHFPGQP